MDEVLDLAKCDQNQTSLYFRSGKKKNGAQQALVKFNSTTGNFFGVRNCYF
jgi:hypothetical protein